MDEIDGSIIEALDSGTVRYSQISKKLGIPLSTVHFRVKRMERDKTIKYYRAEIDWKKAGLGLTAFIFINIDVELLKRLKKSQKRLLEELVRIPYVQEGFIITGDSDILLRIAARDSEHLSRLLMDSIDLKEGVVKTKTVIAL